MVIVPPVGTPVFGPHVLGHVLLTTVTVGPGHAAAAPPPKVTSEENANPSNVLKSFTITMMRSPGVTVKTPSVSHPAFVPVVSLSIQA